MLFKLLSIQSYHLKDTGVSLAEVSTKLIKALPKYFKIPTSIFKLIGI